MIKQNPRIYVYKITFEEVPYYYYGSHKEKRFGEHYMGSPVTHKWMWDFYTPQIQILQFFEFSDEGYKQARQIENRLIIPFYNDDPLCLNEQYGGNYSLKICRENGKKSGQKTYELGIGVHRFSFEEKSNAGKKGGNINKQNGTGVCGLTPEQRIEAGKKGGKISGEKTYELSIGIHGRTKEQMSKDGKKAAQKCKKLGVGIYKLTFEQKSKIGKKAAETNMKNGTGIFKMTTEEKSVAGKKGGKITSSQKWQCTVTGFVSNAGPLSRYQIKKGIDTSNRIRIQ